VQQTEDAEDDDSDDYDDDNDGFWLAPRTACRLWHAGLTYVNYCVDYGFAPLGTVLLVIDDMPDVVKPYARRKTWMGAYAQAAVRLVRSLGKGLGPQPDCTGALLA
jgi:hypothetical protein